MRKEHPNCPDCRCMEEEFQEVGPMIWFCQPSEEEYWKMIDRLELRDYPVSMMYSGIAEIKDPIKDKFPRYPGDKDGRLVKHVKGDLLFLPHIVSLPGPLTSSFYEHRGWNWKFLNNLVSGVHETGQALDDQEIIGVIHMCGFIPKETVHA